MAYGQTAINQTGCDSPAQPSIALDRLVTLENKIGALARKLKPVLMEKPNKECGVMPAENQLLTMISRQIMAIEELTNAIDL